MSFSKQGLTSISSQSQQTTGANTKQSTSQLQPSAKRRNSTAKVFTSLSTFISEVERGSAASAAAGAIGAHLLQPEEMLFVKRLPVALRSGCAYSLEAPMYGQLLDLMFLFYFCRSSESSSSPLVSCVRQFKLESLPQWALGILRGLSYFLLMRKS